MSTSQSTSPSTPSQPANPASSSSRVRLLVLVTLLGIMLGALWYDWKVARPAVENAYARIAQMNSEINGRGGKQYMTNQDVQTELKRSPIDSFTDGGYMVEVYGWRAGLPTKTHKYYAVYADGTPYIFLKHYMNYIDREELKDLPTILVAPTGNMTDLVDSAMPTMSKGGEPKRNSPAKDGTETATTDDGTKSNAAPEKSDDIASAVKESEDAAPNTAKADSKSGEKKATAASSDAPIPTTVK